MDEAAAFTSPAFRRLERLAEQLAASHGYVAGDVNWGGILNLALDLRGQDLLLDLADQPDQVRAFFDQIGRVIERFVDFVESKTGSSSISVNRNVRHRPGAVFLHSECTHTMVSTAHYEEFLLPFDIAWSRWHQPLWHPLLRTGPAPLCRRLRQGPAPGFPRRGLGRRPAHPAAAFAQHLPEHPPQPGGNRQPDPGADRSPPCAAWSRIQGIPR